MMEARAKVARWLLRRSVQLASLAVWLAPEMVGAAQP
jgi:hypothetical protein